MVLRRRDGYRGVHHRARIRATRWLPTGYHRGNGMLQMTGRAAHRRIGKMTGFDLENPAAVRRRSCPRQ